MTAGNESTERQKEIHSSLLSLGDIPFIEEKQRIGRFASTLISHGESLLIDGGSTTLLFSSYLKDKSHMMVITNSYRIGTLIGGDKYLKNKFILLGGESTKEAMPTYGEYTCEVLSTVKVNLSFMSVSGISPSGALYASTKEAAMAKSYMISAAHKVIILADYSKFNTETKYKIGDLSSVDMLITDKRISRSEISRLQRPDLTIHTV